MKILRKLAEVFIKANIPMYINDEETDKKYDEYTDKYKLKNPLQVFLIGTDPVSLKYI